MMAMYYHSSWRGCLATIGAALLAACAPGPSGQPSTPTPPTARPTYGLSLRYTPQVSLRLWRDGLPYSGAAAIQAYAALDEPSQRAGAGWAGQAEQGRLDVPRSVYGDLASQPRVVLRLEDGEVALGGGQSNPFRCASELQEASGQPACQALMPPPSASCDAQGELEWRRVAEGREAEREACWRALDEPTAVRLAGVPRAADAQVCFWIGQSIAGGAEILRPEPFIARCQGYLGAEAIRALTEAMLRVSLAPDLARAKAGGSLEMMRFYARYRALARREAEEIRLLAERRFGPADAKAWRALRERIENFSTRGEYKATLCDVGSSSVQLALAAYTSTPPRYEASEAPRQSARLPQRERAMLGPLIEFVRGQTGKKEVELRSGCTRGLHWYLAGAQPG